jgi:hypothetical protein
LRVFPGFRPMRMCKQNIPRSGTDHKKGYAQIAGNMSNFLEKDNRMSVKLTRQVVQDIFHISIRLFQYCAHRPSP